MKLESTEFFDKLVMEHKRKIRIRDNSKVFWFEQLEGITAVN